MAGRKAKGPAELHALIREFERRVTRLVEAGGSIHDAAKASTIYNMMDDSAPKAARTQGYTGNYERLRITAVREGCEAREQAQNKRGPTKAVLSNAMPSAQNMQIPPLERV